jgi:hypothetical protein
VRSKSLLREAPCLAEVANALTKLLQNVGLTIHTWQVERSVADKSTDYEHHTWSVVGPGTSSGHFCADETAHLYIFAREARFSPVTVKQRRTFAMAITLNREAYNEFRCFGMPDEYPKYIRDAVRALRRRGHDASIALLQYLVEERLVTPRDDRWTEGDNNAAAHVARAFHCPTSRGVIVS